MGAGVAERLGGERAEAKARMTHANDTYGNLPQVSLGPTRDKVGAALGIVPSWAGKMLRNAKVGGACGEKG